ncbi:glycine oxidase ThiO [Cohnella sp. CFH 77786]|uniref:glycine oxidase ThiO n=1 Tax=Cohnella sp. CFH 77786 TaxID=2662265 RepID=UPI001C60E7F0|nr:glycine oxidase ThiO [Cohnella sp. CFH 77786]MBW5446961.1 glycine oxidase ThiO [Cohnella sp. CFH 77786]
MAGSDVLVVGGGIIGLAAAWEAAKRGFRVTVVEKEGFGGQASGAAAGMLAPYSENPEGPDPFFRLCLDSLSMYPEFVREIEETSGMDAELRRTGSLGVALHEADLLPLLSRSAWQLAYGASCELVDADALRRLEPRLAAGAAGGLWCPAESHVQAPKLVRALEEACRRSGVALLGNAGDVTDFEIVREAGVSLATERLGKLSAGRAVLCTGAWSASWARWLPLSIPVHPVRGQICAYEGAASEVRHMVFSSQAYWVGKNDGSLVCGASEDVAGFERSVTAQGIGRLTRWSGRMFPFLAGVGPLRSWAGLRPATRDGWPLIGPVPEVPEVIVAAGHYRNGILLSPATAALVGDMLDGKGAGAAYGNAFAPDRFTRRKGAAG